MNKKVAIEVIKKLKEYYPEAMCSLAFKTPFQMAIAVILSAQCTDARVNMVTKKLFTKYDIFSLATANIEDIKKIIKPVGTFTRKSLYIKEIAIRLVKDYNGTVPNDRKYLESLPGVGRKTCNVVLSNIYNVPAIAVDTHVDRVSKRLGLAKSKDDVYTIEKKLMKKVPKDKWSRTHHQLVLFGRYICKAKRPLCSECLLKEECKEYKND